MGSQNPLSRKCCGSSGNQRAAGRKQTAGEALFRGFTGRFQIDSNSLSPAQARGLKRGLTQWVRPPLLRYGVLSTCRPCRGWRERRGGLLLVGHQRFGGQQGGGDGSGVLQSGAGDLSGVHDAGGDHVHIGLVVGVEAVAGLAGLLDLLQNHGAVDAGVGGNLPSRAR